VSSRGEGPSRPKGKAIDPLNWGNINLSRESLDIEAQAAALNSFNVQKATTSKHHEKRTSHRKERSRSPSREKIRQGRRSGKTAKKPGHRHHPAEVQPAAQIAPKSYLGTALRNVGSSSRFKHSPTPSSSSSEFSSSSSDDSSQPSSSAGWSDGSDESQRPRKRRRDNQHGRNKRRRRVSSSSSASGSNIKPIPPKEYNGAADVRAYHRFVRESEAYLRDGKVRGRRKVFLLSYHLSGKAYDFYTQKVAINEEQWTLTQFYRELFNYCFPVDYRMQLRKTLARTHQNDKSVAEYTHELQDLFNMIGDISTQDQVIKFWNGARPAIQKELWKNKLNPEISSWRKVVAQAEIIEIAENVAERHDRRPRLSSQPSGAASGPSGSNSRTKSQPHGSYVRAVAFESNRHHSNRNRHTKPRHSTPAGKTQRSGTPYSRQNTPPSKWRTDSGSGPVAVPQNRTSKFVPRKITPLSEKQKAEYRAAGK
jgi:hypothetical protein